MSLSPQIKSQSSFLWPVDYLQRLVIGRFLPGGVRTGNLPIIPFQVSRSRGGRCACRQSGVFLCAEPSFLEHNGGIVTYCFSQRYRSQAVVKRSNSKSTIEFP